MAPKESVLVRGEIDIGGVSIPGVKADESVVTSLIDRSCTRAGEDVIGPSGAQDTRATDVVLRTCIDVAHDVQCRRRRGSANADIACGVNQHSDLVVAGIEDDAALTTSW